MPGRENAPWWLLGLLLGCTQPVQPPGGGVDAGVPPPQVDAGVACGDGNCAGCCLEGMCVRLEAQTAGTCGSQGSACGACPAGQVCDVGICSAPAGCSQENCPSGCCYAGTCVALNAQNNAACGTGAAPCGRCLPGTLCSNGACATAEPASLDAGACGPATCPDGCCSGEACIPGSAQNAAACGAGGGACESCLTGQACVAGACEAGASCGPDSCLEGCCAGAVCVTSAAQGPAACGTAAEACVACAAGEACTAGACAPPGGGGGGGTPPDAPCDAANCPGGCCFGDVCVGAGSQGPGMCGSGGQACAACAPGATCAAGSCVGGTPDAGDGSAPGTPELPDLEDNGTASGGSLSARGATAVPALAAGSPGGWATSTLVFSQGRLVKDAQDNDSVQLGWVVLDSRATGTACGVTGPRAVRHFYAWKHASYAPGDCQDDKVSGVNFARWDHAALTVDGCPGKTEFVENELPATRPFLSNCLAHVTSGFGDPAGRKPQWVGNYLYDPAARTLVFNFEVNGSCRKEYYRDLTLDASRTLLSMRLDGARTGDTSPARSGTGSTHGYGYASPKDMGSAASFSSSMQALRTAAQGPNSGKFLADEWRFRESGSVPQPEHKVDNAGVNYEPEFCKTGVSYDHSCNPVKGTEPRYLAKCATGRTAYLRWILNPFAATSPREQLFWAWHADKAKNWTGCYHRGSHANPLLQVVDAMGTFRGYVGVEMQRSAAVEARSGGGYREATESYKDTDYRVWRWIRSGFEEVP